MKHQNTQSVGALGEEIASRFLVKRGFKVIDRNYRKKWGEIDLVANKENKIFFIEVKSVSYAFNGDGSYRPEDNVHPEKIKRLYRTIESYLMEKRQQNSEWSLGVIAVFLDEENKESQVRYTENIF